MAYVSPKACLKNLCAIWDLRHKYQCIHNLLPRHCPRISHHQHNMAHISLHFLEKRNWFCTKVTVFQSLPRKTVIMWRGWERHFVNLQVRQQYSHYCLRSKSRIACRCLSSTWQKHDYLVFAFRSCLKQIAYYSQNFVSALCCPGPFLYKEYTEWKYIVI